MLRDPRPRWLVPSAVRTGLVWPLLACLALAALTLLRPAAPTYDPWAWIVWGREVVHLDLDTVDGPSWKPLPVLLTTPFALLGPAAPYLWLLVARAGTLGALVVTYRLGARLGGAAAGACAALLLVASAWLTRNALLGNSEGLLILAVVWAAERHLDGHRGQAFALGLAAGMLRPEAWPFLGLYALWLLREDRRRLPWLAGGLALLPLLWLLPELWGSGNLWRASERASTPNPNSPAFADRPSLAVLDAWRLLVAPATWIGLAAAAVLGLRRSLRALARPAAWLALLAIAWLALVALMTEAGYSGNPRYLLAPTALLYVVAGAGFSWVAGRLLLAARSGEAPVSAAGVAIVALVVALVAGSAWWGAPTIRYGVRDTRFQAEVAHSLDVAVARAGGRDRLLACGTPVTNRYLVQLAAWRLGVHGDQVEYEPTGGPMVVLRARDALGGRRAPAADLLAGRPDRRTAARTDTWEIETACGS